MASLISIGENGEKEVRWSPNPWMVGGEAGIRREYICGDRSCTMTKVREEGYCQEEESIPKPEKRYPGWAVGPSRAL
jgi:hypothetical protein